MTMLPDSYREQLRELVDAVEDPGLTDIAFLASTRPRPRRGRRVVAGVACVAVAALVVLVVLGIVSVTRTDDVGSHTNVLAVTPTVPTSCVVGVDGLGGCSMRPAKASRYLGFTARVPKGVPEGWVVERKQLRVYRDPLPPDAAPLPVGFESVAIYNQVWTPAGVDLNRVGTCPDHLQVRQRPAASGEGFGASEPVDLGNGRVVYGAIAQSSSCAGTATSFTSVIWVRGGISFLVSAQGLDRAAALQVIGSIYDS